MFALAVGFAAISPVLMAQPPVVSPGTGPNETIQLFDGKTLNGWAGHFKHWSVENGEIVGRNTAPVPVCR
jgi:hypothetical protein